jgi:hypothetical protein
MSVLVALDAGKGVPAMTKVWSLGVDGLTCQPYGLAWQFRVQTLLVTTFSMLCAVLVALKRMPTACVIRGSLLATANWQCTPRRLYARDGKQATFAECLRRWVLLDYDTWKRGDFPDPITDPLGCIAAIRLRLPEGLREVACFWSFSGSTGMKPDKMGVHFWFLLNMALGWRDVEAFILACGADVAMSRAVQVHYTAAPGFEAPLTDPLPQRFGTLPGIERVPEAVCTKLVNAGHLQRATEKNTFRSTDQKPTKVVKSALPSELKREPAPGMIGDDYRHAHLIPIAGFCRNRGLDAAGLRAVLLAENANHCDPPLSTDKVERMAHSFAVYKVDPEKLLGSTWNRSIALAAGMHRHNACKEAMTAAVAYLLGNAAVAQRVVAVLMMKPSWEIEMAEISPGLVLPEEPAP